MLHLVKYFDLLLSYYIMLSFYPFPLTPLFILNIGQIIGIYSQSCLPSNLLLIAATGLILMTALLYIKKYPLEYILLPLAVLFGSGLYQLQQNKYHYFLSTIDNRPVTIKGIIKDITTNQKIYAPHCVLIQAYCIENDNVVFNNRNILIYTLLPPNVQVEDEIVVKNGIIKMPKNNDYVRYLIKENISATLFVNKKNIAIIHKSGFIKRYIFETKNRLLNAMQDRLDNSTFYMFSSLFLGNKNSSSTEKDIIEDHFKTWGISHYLARSGLHLIIFIYIWQTIFQYIPLPFIVKQIVLLLISFLYAFFTWSSISFLRALWTFFLCKIYTIKKKSFNFINILSLISLGFLSYNPSQLFFLDFQLSFILTFALAWHNTLVRIIKEK